MSWEEAKLGDVATYVRGVTFKPSDRVPVGSPGSVVCMRTGNIQEGLDEGDLIAIPATLVHREEQLLRPGDLLVSSANSWNLVGKCTAVPTLPYRAAAGGFIGILRHHPTRIDPRYLYRWLNSEPVQHRARGCARQTTNIANLAISRFLELVLPLPPLPEQRRIAAILDKADAIRRKRQESLRVLDDLLRSTFLDMFGDPVRNERGWETVKLGEVAAEAGAIVDGPFGSSLKPESYVGEGVLVVRNTNILDDHFDISSFKYVTDTKFDEISRSEVRPGDILISTKGTLGRACEMPSILGRAVLSASGTVRVRLSKNAGMAEPFLIGQMVSAPFRRYLRGQEAGTNQKYLTLSTIRCLAVIRPPIDLQADYCRARDSLACARQNVLKACSRADTLVRAASWRAFQGQL